MGSYCVWLCACVCWTVALADLQLFEDDVCKQTEGKLWTCKSLSSCPKAQAQSKKGKTPDLCNFDGNEPIICCEPDVKQAPVGAKSKQMCKKYAEYVFYALPDPYLEGVNTKQDTCAIVEPLLTNGKKAEPREYPHMALVGFGKKESIEWGCGGSLISERYILSAAHCVDGGRQLGLAKWVRLGDYNIKSNVDEESGESQPQDFEIVQRISHPGYKSPSLYHDIALFKLAKNVEFNEYIRPICLQTDHQFANTYAIATGWGKTAYRGKESDYLLKVNLTIIPRVNCSNYYKLSVGSKPLINGIRDVSMFCAGDVIHGNDTCQGDSGGPLQVPLSEPYCMYKQVGITSFGQRCGGNKPSVFTRVSHYVSWIESIVWR